jgi:hypothetical protein
MNTASTQDTAEGSLETLIAEETALPLTGAARHWVEHFREVPGVASVLFYGSGLWQSEAEPEDMIFDFYLLTNHYRDFDPKRILAMAGTLIPPNVYYREQQFDGRTLRCKFAVMTVAQFSCAARGKSFTPHIWARFCQPCRIPHAATEELRQQLVTSLEQSVLMFHRRTLHLIGTCSLIDFWGAGLRSTYADEIRSEKKGRLNSLFNAAEDSYMARTRLALAQIPEMGGIVTNKEVRSNLSGRRKRLYQLGLRLKRPLTKMAIVFRFIKAGFTFQGGLDYARWKIERHSGVRIEVTDRQRRHPILGGLYLFVKALMRGGLR